MARKPGKSRQVVTLTHEEASRKNIPTAEYQSVTAKEDQDPIEVAWRRRVVAGAAHSDLVAGIRTRSRSLGGAATATSTRNSSGGARRRAGLVEPRRPGPAAVHRIRE